MRYLSLVFIAIVALYSCTPDVKESSEYQKLLNEHERLKAKDQANEAVIDTFITSFEEIQANLDTIKAREKIITAKTRNSSETTTLQKDIIKEDIQLIYQLMNENKRKIAELNKQLKSKDGNVARLQAVISELEAEITEKDLEIETLKQELANMDIVIENLVSDVDKLAVESEEKSKIINDQTAEMNTAYYVIGDDKDLRDKGVITKEGGFIGLGKSDKISGDIDSRHFTKINILQKKAFVIGSKKAKLISTHPSSSYELKGDGRVDSLVIKDPYSFWKTSKYLVVVKD